jgi:phage terminase large subunit-like protein
MVKAARADKLDSLNVSFACLDEMHEHRDLGLYNVMKSGTLNRSNPIIWITSTAGFNRDFPFYNLVGIGKKVLRGEVNNDSFFYALYTLDDDDDYNNPECWVKANPNIGVTVQLEDLKTEFDQAKLDGQTFVNFLTKNLNVYVDQIDQWIPSSDLEACSDAPPMEEFKGESCWVGVDLSTVIDLAAVVFTFYKDGKYYAYPKFYCTQGTSKQRAGAVDLTPWIQAGNITECKTRTIDLQLIADDIINVNKDYNVQKVAYDAYNSKDFISIIQRAGIDTQAFSQSMMNFNAPTKKLERLIYARGIKWGNADVMNWNFRNVVMGADHNNNYKPLKNKGLDSIDGVISLIESIGIINENELNVHEAWADLFA